jgi:urease accessory protein
MIQGALQKGSIGPVAPQRAEGRAFLSVGLSRGASRLIDLSQSGAARIMLPSVAGPRPEAVFLNTSGGLTSGDRIEFSMSVAGGAALTATTQTAERAYLAPAGPARLRVTADVGPGAALDWLPQETILFQGAGLSRETRIDLGPDARCLLVEIVVLGRRAMGEVVTHARLLDRRTVTAQGRCLHVEALDLSPEGLARAASPAMLGPAHVCASLALCGSGTEAAAEALRVLPVPEGVIAATSGWNGRTLLRATATDLWPLKIYLGRVIARLTDRPLPRVWQMQGVAP